MNVLSEANRKAHANQPVTSEGRPLTLWQPSPRFVHCCIESRGCKFSNTCGACVMCDYGRGRNLSPAELACALREQLLPYAGKLDTLLIGSYGSVLDEYEVSPECLEELLRFLREFPVHSLILETHCATVTKEKLAHIRAVLPAEIKITIEMGYESCDPFVLQHCLNKPLDLWQLSQTICMIGEMGMYSCCNVFLGAPFLSPADQLESARQSILWACRQGADSIVLFPANIKPFTLLRKLYDAGVYSPVPQWMIPALLRRLPPDILKKIGLSWYGNRENVYNDDSLSLIPPVDCDGCHELLFDFYRDFLQAEDGKRRAELTEALWNAKTTCSCRDKLLSSLLNSSPRPTSAEIEAVVTSL